MNTKLEVPRPERDDDRDRELHRHAKGDERDEGVAHLEAHLRAPDRDRARRARPPRRAGKSGKIVVPLCGPCTSGRDGTKSVTAAAAAAMIAGKAYVNVHTKANPNGEIRGR